LGLRELVDLIKGSGTSASKMLRRDERLERLKDAVQTLNPDHRKVMFLTRVKGLPVKEVARLMGRSPGAVSMLLLRALDELKHALGPTDSVHLPEDTLKEEDFGL
jgi:RNA polymerase sigma-70 factor (ECF subfamily)